MAIIWTLIIMLALFMLTYFVWDFMRILAEREDMKYSAEKDGKNIEFCERCGNLLTQDEYKICSECVHKINEIDKEENESI